MKKRLSSTVLSCLFWGSGQFFICRQRTKGLLFFLAQALFFGIEFQTGYWINYFVGEISDFQIRLYGGFFTKGIWGLCTLGQVPGIHGDYSTMLMINGIIALIVLLAFLGIYVWNITDAYKAGKIIDTAGVPERSGACGKKFYRTTFPYIVLLPLALVVLFIVIMPIIFSILTAFTNYDINHLPPSSLVSWVGLQNFAKIAKVPIWTQTFLSVLLWTVTWSLVATFSSYFLGLFQALLLNSKCVKHRSFFRSIFILPWAIPAMISLLMFRNLLNGQFGPLNQFLMNCGLISTRIPFLTVSFNAKVSILLVNLWLGFPSFMLMLEGVLSNQDQCLYEAARIDGANAAQTFFNIKLPLLTKATAPLIVMSLAFNFNSFGSIYFLTNGGPADSAFQFAGDTDILISWIYNMTLNQKMFSMAAVMSLLIFIFTGIVSYWNFKRTTSFKEM